MALWRKSKTLTQILTKDKYQQYQGSQSSQIRHHTLPICLNGQNMEGVHLFIYLVGIVFVDNGTELDGTQRIYNVRSAFDVLFKIWNTNIKLMLQRAN